MFLPLLSVPVRALADTNCCIQIAEREATAENLKAI